MKKRNLLFGAVATFALGMIAVPNVYAEEAEEVNSWSALKTCLEATESKTCKVTSEITDSSGDYIVVRHDKVLDLQGFTVNMPNTIYDYSKLTITGTTGGKLVGPSTPKAGLMVMVANKGTLNIDNATLQANETCDGTVCEGQVISISGVNNHVTIGKSATLIGGYGVMFQYHYTGTAADTENKKVGANGSILDVYGTIRASEHGGMGITIKGDITGENHIISDNPPVVNIYEGSKVIAKESAAIYGAGYGIWNIKGGYIEGDEALSIKSGVFNVNGGTLKAVGEYVEKPTPAAGEIEPTGAAISITSNKGYDGHIKINVSGNPEIISEKGNAIYEGVIDGDKSEVEEIVVKGGKFKSAEGIPNVVISDEFNESHEGGFISGGTFLSGNTPANVATYLTEGLKQNEDGTVVPPTPEKPTPTTPSNPDVNGDQDDVPNTGVENPQTGDGIITYIVMGTLSLLGLAGITTKRLILNKR